RAHCLGCSHLGLQHRQRCVAEIRRRAEEHGRLLQAHGGDGRRGREEQPVASTRNRVFRPRRSGRRLPKDGRPESKDHFGRRSAFTRAKVSWTRPRVENVERELPPQNAARITNAGKKGSRKGGKRSHGKK